MGLAKVSSRKAWRKTEERIPVVGTLLRWLCPLTLKLAPVSTWGLNSWNITFGEQAEVLSAKAGAGPLGKEQLA